MSNLVIDIGNSRVKCGVFKRRELQSIYTETSLSNKLLSTIIAESISLEQVIISSVREDIREEVAMLRAIGLNPVIFSQELELPITNCYATPHTLGSDRLAAAVGAEELFPKQDKLVIDAGTAITIDFINGRSEFIGGVISPGLEMRFRALHTFTGKLPKESVHEQNPLFGDSTSLAIVAGVQNGALFEIQGYIDQLRREKSNFITIFTGGDTNFFEKRLKYAIFANPHLVLVGLNRVLEDMMRGNRERK